MKNKILRLRESGKTYREIQHELGCSRSLISYYVNPNGKKSNLDRQNRNRFRRRTDYKNLLGGKCCLCNYAKCMDALHFHHRDPAQKRFEISDALFGREYGKYTDEEIVNELGKCILVCANCHHELHSKNTF